MLNLKKSRARAAGLAMATSLVAIATSCGSSGKASTAQNTTLPPQISAVPAGVNLAGPPGTPAPKPLTSAVVLKVGIPSKLELEAPIFLAQDEGEFAKENLKVSFVYDTVPNLLTLLGENRIDLVYAGAQALVFNAIHSGIPIRWVSGVASAAPDSGLFISTKYGSSSSSFNPAVLKGLTIGVNPGGLAAPSEYGLYYALKQAGLSSSSIKMVSFNDPGSMVSALASGQIQGATLGPPYTSALQPGTAFQAEPGYPPTIQIAGYFSTTRLLQQNRAAGVAFFRAIERTINTYLTGNYHQNKVVMTLMAKDLGTTVAELDLAPSVPFDLSIPPATVLALQQMYQAVPGTLQYSGEIQPSALVDLSLVVDAAEGK